MNLPIVKVFGAIAAITMLLAGRAGAWTAIVSPVLGDQRIWALDFKVSLEQPGGTPPAELSLGGDLIVTISAIRSGEYDAAVELANVTISGNADANVPPGSTDELRRRLGRRFWATWRDDGALLAVHFYKDVSASDRNLLQTMLTEAQFIRPPAVKPEWSMLERDGAGAYLAIYLQAASAVFVKRKLKYVDTSGVAGAPLGALRVTVDRSELRFTLGSDGEIAALDAIDRWKIGMPVQNADQLKALMEIHLSNLRRGRADNLIGSLAAALPGVESSPIVTHATDPEAARRVRDEQLLENHSTDSVLNAAFTGAADAELADRLAALFRRRPEAVASAVALLKTHGPQTRLTDALGHASTPEALEALGRLARDEEQPPQLRVDALVGLAMAEHASLESMHTAVNLLDDPDARVSAAASMVAGALARSGRAVHATDADAVDTAIIQRYRSSTDERTLANLLAGLGNSASPAACAVVEEALHDSRPVVRRVAVRGLRLAQGPEIEGLLSDAIASDSDVSVRAGAILAAGFQSPFGAMLRRAVIEAARTDPADSVRSAAVTLLARTASQSAQVTETLAWIAANDVKPRIRRQAREALTPEIAPASKH